MYKMTFAQTVLSLSRPGIVAGLFNVVGAMLDRALPEIPIQVFRNRVGTFRATDALRPNRAVGPHVQLGDVTDEARLDDLHRATESVVGAALVAHLRGHFLLLGHLGHETCLVDGLCEWLLNVNVFAELHRLHTGNGVHVVRGRDGDGVDGFLHLIEHLAEILKRRGAGVFLPSVTQGVGIDITERDDIGTATGRVVGVAGALAARTDRGEVDLAVEVFAAKHERAKAGRAQCSGGRVGDELTARNVSLRFCIHVSVGKN